jgi:cytoskeleton protein RodZ
MDVGTELRAARQRAGLSREQLSQRTRIQVAKIVAIEQNAFDRLAAGLNLDRIVRAYAHEVGLDDSNRLVEQARAAYRMAVPALATGRPPDLAPADGEAFDEFPAESTLLSFESAPLSPAAASTPAPEAARRRRFGKAIFPVALIAAFVGGAALGAFLTSRSQSNETLGPVASLPANPRDSPEADRTHGVGTTGPAATDSAAPPISAVTPARPVDLPPPAPPPRATGAIPAAAKIPAAAHPPEPRAGGGPSPMPASDLTGEWTLNTVVESSSLSMYEGLRLGYRLQLEQRGNAVRGSGRKVLENGNATGGGAQTPITVEGTVEGDRVRLTFAERGVQRSSSGTFVLFREGTDGLRGRFASDAARATGRVDARRR